MSCILYHVTLEETRKEAIAKILRFWQCLHYPELSNLFCNGNCQYIFSGFLVISCILCHVPPEETKKLAKQSLKSFVSGNNDTTLKYITCSIMKSNLIPFFVVTNTTSSFWSSRHTFGNKLGERSSHCFHPRVSVTNQTMERTDSILIFLVGGCCNASEKW